MEARRFHGGDGAVVDQITGTIATAWNKRHLSMIHDGAALGLGGLIRAGHVSHILRSKGYDVKAWQMGGVEPSISKKKEAKQTLGKNDVRNLSYKGTEVWLRKLNKSKHNMKEKRHEAILEHFIDKPDGCRLSL